MSTIDTHMNLASSYFVVDLWGPLRGGQVGEREGVLVARISGVFFLGLGGAIAMFNDSIRGLFELLLQLVAGAGAVFLIRWFWWRVNAWSELSAMIASLVVATTLNLSNAHGWIAHRFSSPEIFVINVGISAAIWVAVALLGPTEDRAHLAAFVRRVRPFGAWGEVREAEAAAAEPAAAGVAEVDAGDAATGAGPAADRPVRDRLLDWGIGIVGLYGCLFGTGKLLLLDFRGGIPWTLVGFAATMLVIARVGRKRETT
jgi:hypothetical protein